MSHQHSPSVSNNVCVLPDPYDFARRGGQLEGSLHAGSSERLKEVVRQPVGESAASNMLHFQLAGRYAGGKHYVDVSVKGDVALSCRRCLDAVACRLDLQSTLMLVQPNAELPDDALEDDSFDPVHVGRDWDVLAAIEDEVLLGLPVAPAHENCAAPGSEQSTAERKESPFAVLHKLKPSSDG